MEKDSFSIGIVPTSVGPFVTTHVVDSAPITTPPTVTSNIPAITIASTVPVLLAYAKPFPNISRIEVFVGHNYK